MKIGMLLSVPFPPREGIGHYVANLSSYLGTRGHQVVILTRGGFRRTEKKIYAGMPVWSVRYFPLYPIHTYIHRYFMNRVIKDLENELDLLHVHSPLVALPQTKLPIVTTVHSPIEASLRRKIRRDWTDLLITLQAPFSIATEKVLFRNSACILATSSSVAGDLASYQVQRSKVMVFGNGVDIEIFRPVKSEGSKTSPYFFTAGRLDYGKGLEDLIRCAEILAEKHPSVRFLVAGSGRLAGTLREMIRKSKLEASVELLGQVNDRHRLAELYQGAIACIHPSHYEGLPTVILEAMSCGIPTIAYDVSGSRDLIQDGRTGYLVPDHRPDLLAEKCISLLEDPKLNSDFGLRARKEVEESYSWTVVGDRYLRLYRSLVPD